MNTTRTHRNLKTVSLRRGRTYTAAHRGIHGTLPNADLQTHYGHLCVEYEGRQAGMLRFRCVGCGDTLFTAVSEHAPVAVRL